MQIKTLQQTKLLDSSSLKSNKKKVDWYAEMELGCILKFYTSLNQLDLDRFAPITKPQTLTLRWKFRYRFPDIFSWKIVQVCAQIKDNFLEN